MELKGFLNSLFTRENATSLSRRDALAGLGLAGALLATPKLLLPSAAEAKTLEKPAEAAGSASEGKPDKIQLAEADGRDTEVLSDATDLSARRYWRRHYWRRRYWRPRYWRRRYWRRRYWRRRYW